MSIQKLQSLPVPSDKWMLANKIVGNSKLPTELVKELFLGVVDQLEHRVCGSFPKEFKHNVWMQVSPEYIHAAEAKHITAFCDNVLKTFNDKEIQDMLQQYNQNGVINNENYLFRIKTGDESYRKNIAEYVMLQVGYMSQKLASATVASFRQGGYSLENKANDSEVEAQTFSTLIK